MKGERIYSPFYFASACGRLHLNFELAQWPHPHPWNCTTQSDPTLHLLSHLPMVGSGHPMPRTRSTRQSNSTRAVAVDMAHGEWMASEWDGPEPPPNQVK